MYITIFNEILLATVKFKLDTDDIVITSISLAAFGVLLILYFNYLLKKSYILLDARYEKSNTDFIYSIDSVLLNHISFSGKLLKNYGESSSGYLENIPIESNIAFNFTSHFSNKVIQNQNVFYELNSRNNSSLKLFHDDYLFEVRKILTTLKNYELGALLMREKVLNERKLSVSSLDGINTFKISDHSIEINALIDKLSILKSLLSEYSYHLETSNANYKTLGYLKIDDLRYESGLVIQQLFDTFHNYGNSIYSLLGNYYDQLNISLNEFSGRSTEYLKHIDYFKLVAEIRQRNRIDENAKIILANIIEADSSIKAVKHTDSNANFYILHFRNDINLFPINIIVDDNNSGLTKAFDLEKSENLDKANIIEPALCKKISDTEYKIISKGIIKVS